MARDGESTKMTAWYAPAAESVARVRWHVASAAPQHARVLRFERACGPSPSKALGTNATIPSLGGTFEGVPPTILLVEDDDGIALAVQRALRHAFDVVIVRVNGNRGAVEYLNQEVPALVITDLGHADGRGEELVEHIRSADRLRSIPIIVLSGQLFYGMDPRLFEHRIDAAFAKPVGFEALFRAVARCLEESDGRVTADEALVRAGTEGASLDYKRTIDLGDKKQRAGLAKDVIAFCNSGGGVIVVGVEEVEPGTFVPIGLGESELTGLEVTRLNDSLRRYVGTEISVGSRRVRVDGKHFVIISIPARKGMLALAREEHQDAGLFPGRIYVRNDAGQSAEVRDAVTLAGLLDGVLRDRAITK